MLSRLTSWLTLQSFQQFSSAWAFDSFSHVTSEMGEGSFCFFQVILGQFILTLKLLITRIEMNDIRGAKICQPVSIRDFLRLQ